MTTIAMTYVVNPFSGLLNKVSVFFQIVGYSRAAGELTRLGYHKEASNCLKMMKELR